MVEVDAIINLAGASIGGESPLNMRWTKKRREVIRNSRINANLAVVEAVTKSEKKPEVLIQPSAVGYYGFHGDEELDETSPPASDFLGKLAVEWEAGTQPVHDQGVRHVVIRNGLVLSPSSSGWQDLVQVSEGSAQSTWSMSFELDEELRFTAHALPDGQERVIIGDGWG